MKTNLRRMICLTFLSLVYCDGVGHPLAFAAEEGKKDAQQVKALVDARVAAWQPTEAERAFDKIGWVKKLGEAERLAQEHQRPIFMFTYDGSDLACFRC